jgi:hypothetical protein
MQQLRRRLALSLGDLKLGSATSDPTTDGALTDTKRVEADSHWNNYFMKIGVDTNSEYLRVAAFTNATNLFGLVPSMAVDHANGVEYELSELFDMEEYQNFIEMGILEMSTHNVLSNLSYTDLTLVQDQWEYSIPNNFRYITEVCIAESDGTYRESGMVHRSHYRVVPDIINKLRFSEWISMQVGRSVRIRGLGEQLMPTTVDTAEVEIDPIFILLNGKMQAFTIMSQRLSGERGQDAGRTARNISQQLENIREMAMQEHRPPADVTVVP